MTTKIKPLDIMLWEMILGCVALQPPDNHARSSLRASERSKFRSVHRMRVYKYINARLGTMYHLFLQLYVFASVKKSLAIVTGHGEVRDNDSNKIMKGVARTALLMPNETGEEANKHGRSSA